nr:translation initiation factor IF-2 [Oryctolagus cuniculus]
MVAGGEERPSEEGSGGRELRGAPRTRARPGWEEPAAAGAFGASPGARLGLRGAAAPGRPARRAGSGGPAAAPGGARLAGLGLPGAGARGNCGRVPRGGSREKRRGPGPGAPRGCVGGSPQEGAGPGVSVLMALPTKHWCAVRLTLMKAPLQPAAWPAAQLVLYRSLNSQVTADTTRLWACSAPPDMRGFGGLNT